MLAVCRSAAFNLLVISGVCVVSIADGSYRRIQNFQVFAVTAVASLAAYVWLLLVVSVFSPNEVELWEALVTIAFFPLLLLVAYTVDRRSRTPNAGQQEMQDLQEAVANKSEEVHQPEPPQLARRQSTPSDKQLVAETSNWMRCNRDEMDSLASPAVVKRVDSLAALNATLTAFTVTDESRVHSEESDNVFRLYYRSLV